MTDRMEPTNRLPGKIIASCGHEITDFEDGEFISTAEEDCEAIDGFVPVVVTGHYCAACAAERKTWPNYLPNEKAEEAWLNRAPLRDVPTEDQG